MNSQKGNGAVRKRIGNGVDKDDRITNDISTVENKNTKGNTKTIGLVFVSLLLDLLAFTMILPLLPSLLDYYNREEGKGNSLYASLLRAVQDFQKFTGAPDRFASVLFGGALGSMYSFLQFLTSPIVGSLSDAYGRKPMLLICLIGITLSHALWSYASTFSIFVLARFIGGLSKANVSLSMAVVTDASNEKTRARGMDLRSAEHPIPHLITAEVQSLGSLEWFQLTDYTEIDNLNLMLHHDLNYAGNPTPQALVGLAFSIGFIVGPVTGAWFALNSDLSSGAWGERPALYALSLSLANILLVFFFIPETLTKDKRAPLSFSLSKSVDFVSPWHLLRFTAVKNLSRHQSEVLSKLGLIYFLYLFIYSGLEFTLTFLTHHTFQYTAMQQGKMFLVMGLIMAVLQGGAARRLGARGAEVAARGALALTPASFLSVAFAALPHPPLFAPIYWLWLGLVLFALSTAFAVSCMTSMAAGKAPSEARGAVLGTLRSLGALARAAGPLLASSVYWCSGAMVTYTIGSIILIIPAVMLIRLKT